MAVLKDEFIILRFSMHGRADGIVGTTRVFVVELPVAARSDVFYKSL
jgi:hypothetical protein